MRRLLLLGLMLALTAGCKKTAAKFYDQTRPDEKAKTLPQVLTHQEGAGQQPSVHAPSGVVINPGGGGGGGGAAQAVRQAVVRTVNRNDMNQIQLFINTASAVGDVPSKAEITATLQREAPNIGKLIQDGVIILTGTRQRESVWAYTYNPQTFDGKHLVISSSGVSDLPTAALTERLKMESGR